MRYKSVAAAAAACGILMAASCGFAAPKHAPEGLKIPVMALDDDEAWLFWNRPADGDDVAYYNVYRDGVLVGSTKTLQTIGDESIASFREKNDKLCGNLLIKHSFHVDGLKASKEYRFTVRAVGHDGKESADSNAVVQMTSAAPMIVNAVDAGAVGDGKTVNTAALQAAIDNLPKGGVLEIPAGVFVSGSLKLRSDMTLQLDRGAVLKGSLNADDYSLAQYTPKGFDGLLNAEAIENVRITGEGTIDGSGWKQDMNGYMLRPDSRDERGVRESGLLAWTQSEKLISQGDTDWQSWYSKRGISIVMKNVKNLYIGGITLTNPPMHMMTLFKVHHVTVNNVRVLTYNCNNGDGLGFTGSDLIVANSYFDCGDDAVVFKAGTGAIAAADKGRIVSDAHIFNNYVRHAHGGVVFGSQTAAGIHDVLAEDNVYNHTDVGLRCKTTKGMGGGAWNIHFRNNVMKDMGREAFIFTTKYRDAYTTDKMIKKDFGGVPDGCFHDILVENCNVYGARRAAIEVYGTENVKHHDITFKNVHFLNTMPVSIENGERINIGKDVTFGFAD